jgi:hypothetical protein
MNSEETPFYYYIKVDLDGKDKTFLIIKTTKSNSNIEKVLKSLKPYLEKFFYYSLEILTLFLFPSLVKMKLLSSEVTKNRVDEKNTILQNLKSSEDYGREFNSYISKMIKGSYYISPDL